MMTRSMTGYGSGQSGLNGVEINVEIRSVNHRYFEFSARYPRGCNFLEEKLKGLVSEYVHRGKVDVYVNADLQAAAQTEIIINHELATAYVNAIRELNSVYSLSGDVHASDLIRNSDIFTLRKSTPDEELIWNTAEEAARMALDAFVKMREAEGAKLREDVLLRARKILEYVEVIEKKSPETVAAYREKLELRMRELLDGVDVDQQRILTEAAIFADKVAVAEETVRLRSHFDQLCELMDSEGSVGRKLDFLLQEFGREVNTIGSKAQDAEIAKIVVDMKAELEKIREQIQNIE